MTKQPNSDEIFENIGTVRQQAGMMRGSVASSALFASTQKRTNITKKHNHDGSKPQHEIKVSKPLFSKTETQRNVLKVIQESNADFSLLLLANGHNNKGITISNSKENNVHHLEQHSSIPLSRQLATHDVTGGYAFPERKNGTRTLINDDGLKIVQQPRFLPRSEGKRDVPAGYTHLKRNNATRNVFKFNENSDDSSTTSSVLTESESTTDDVSVSTADLEFIECTLSQQMLHKANCTFEEFVIKTIERQKRRYRRGIRKQNNAVLFSCSDKVSQDYAGVLTSYENVGDVDEHIEMNLAAASHVVQQFLNVVEILHIADKIFTKPSEDTKNHGSPLQVVYGDMEKYILTQFSMLTADMKKSITPGQAAKMIRWYETYLQRINETFPNDTNKVKPSCVWKSDLTKLLNRYLEYGVQREMNTLIERIDNKDLSIISADDDNDLRLNTDGQIITSIPEDILYLVDIQIQVATEYLNKHNIPSVLLICNEEISTMVSKKREQLEMNWQKISLSRYCAIINDTSRLADMLEIYNSAFTSKYNHSSNISLSNIDPSLDKVFDKITTVERQLTEFSLQATEYLCRSIIQSLEEPESGLSIIGTSLWVKDETGSILTCALATLQRYFKELESGLCSDYFFPKVLKQCFILTLQVYVESFYLNTIQSGVKDAERVARCLREDYFNMVKFFNESFFERHTRRAGLLSSQDINLRLMIIQSMSRIINPTVSPVDLMDDTRTILESVTMNTTSRLVDGVKEQPNPEQHQEAVTTAAAILHLAGLRTYHCHDRESTIRWVRNIVLSEKSIHEKKKSNIRHHRRHDCLNSMPVIRLPNLHESPYIYNFRLNQNDIQRYFSTTTAIANDVDGDDDGTLVTIIDEYAQAIKDLLDTADYKKQVKMYIPSIPTINKYRHKIHDTIGNVFSTNK